MGGRTKTGSPRIEKSKNKIKMDLWNDSINSIMKYSKDTIKRTQSEDGNMQKFSSKCLRGITIGKYDADNENNINNNTITKIITRRQRIRNYKEINYAKYTDGNINVVCVSK